MKISKLIKNIFGDVIMLYKNFLDWNLHKIVYMIYSIILAFVLSLPFLFIIFALFYVFNLGEYINSTQINPYSIILFFFEKPIIFFIVFALMFIIFLALLFGYLYNLILLFNLNLNYLEGKKIKLFKNNLFFDYKFIWKYIKTSSWVLLLLIVPFLIFLIGFIILFFAFGGYDSINIMLQQKTPSLFVYLLLILIVLCFILFFYIGYRVWFSFIFLLDEKEEKHNAIYFIKKSLKGTKKFKVLLRFLLVAVLFWLMSFLFNSLEDHYYDKYHEISDYIVYKNLGDEEKAILDKSEDVYYLSSLKESFGKYNSQELNSQRISITIFYYIFVIFNFLFIYGVFEMILVSFYKKIILDKNKTV